MLFKKRRKKKGLKIIVNNFLGSVSYGLYGIKAEETAILTAKQLEATRRVITHETKRSCTIILRVFFHQPLTGKPRLTRMGRGSGAVKTWIFHIKRGVILLELANVSQYLALGSFKKACLKLPTAVSFVLRDILSLK